MAKYSTADGVRGITGDDGLGWLPDGKRWQCSYGTGYTLEKRVRNLKDSTPDTGWYLYSNAPGGLFGEWCGSRILDAVDVANELIAGVE